MLALTYKTISFVVENDPEITREHAEEIKRACKCPAVQAKRKLITAKKVMELLEISRPTLRKYVLEKKLEEIVLSARKKRYDLDQVMRFAQFGDSLKTV